MHPDFLAAHTPDRRKQQATTRRCCVFGRSQTTASLSPVWEGQVVTGDMHADLADLAGGADPGQQRLGFVRRQLRRIPPGVSSASSRCSRHTAWVRSAVSSSRRPQQPQAHQRTVTGDRGDAGAVQGASPTDTASSLSVLRPCPRE
jgi:hypothetical protein